MLRGRLAALSDLFRCCPGPFCHDEISILGRAVQRAAAAPFGLRLGCELALTSGHEPTRCSKALSLDACRRGLHRVAAIEGEHPPRVTCNHAKLNRKDGVPLEFQDAFRNRGLRIDWGLRNRGSRVKGRFH